MSPQPARKDLIVLSADKSMKLAMENLLARSAHMGLREISSDVLAHPDRDPGVLNRAHDFLRSYTRQYRHAIAICDREGSGRDSSRNELEAQLEQRLRANGWDDRAAAIVIDPELEIWMWGDWDALVQCSGWSGDAGSLRVWLYDQRLLDVGAVKPIRPKEALERVLRQTRRPRSSALFESMSTRADTTHCADAAFAKVRSVLRAWFPP